MYTGVHAVGFRSRLHFDQTIVNQDSHNILKVNTVPSYLLQPVWRCGIQTCMQQVKRGHLVIETCKELEDLCSTWTVTFKAMMC